VCALDFADVRTCQFAVEQQALNTVLAMLTTAGRHVMTCHPRVCSCVRARACVYRTAPTYSVSCCDCWPRWLSTIDDYR
jgi:hypothetical protein